MTVPVAELIVSQALSPDDYGAPVAYLRLVAVALVGWYLFAFWVWFKYRAPNQAWVQFLFGGWVLLDRRTFRTEGHSWLAGVRWTFLLVVVPLIAVLFWKWPP